MEKKEPRTQPPVQCPGKIDFPLGRKSLKPGPMF